MKHRYVYDGPVFKFNTVVANNWHGSTWAVSDKQAASNLAYQFKKQSGLTANTKIALAKLPIAIQ